MLVGVRGLIERALHEGWSLVLEGVHLVPGMLPPVEGALVVHCVLAIEDEELHASHFWVRDAHSDGLRPVQKYLDPIGDIGGSRTSSSSRRGSTACRWSRTAASSSRSAR